MDGSGRQDCQFEGDAQPVKADERGSDMLWSCSKYRVQKLAGFTADVRLWYLQDGLQLNPEKSQALIVQRQMSYVKQPHTRQLHVSVAVTDG